MARNDTMILNFTEFHGMVPRRSRRLLPPEIGQEVYNSDVLSGSLIPFKAPKHELDLTNDLQISLYRYTEGNSWLYWDTDVDVIRGPLADDQYKRIYYTGDGLPKVRGIQDSQEFEYDLGVPKPTAAPAVAVSSQGDVTWTQEWHYFYEEPGGVQVDIDEGTLIVEETVAGETFTMSVPAKVAASANAVFVPYFDAFDSSGNLLGRLYPKISKYRNNSTFFLQGAEASGEVEIDGPNATFTVTYDTASNSTNYVLSRAYVYTFVTGWGEEGPPSAASTVVDVSPTQQATLSNLETSVAGSRNVTLKRIYRTVTGASGSTSYFLVAEIPVADTSYVDAHSDDDLGDLLPSLDWEPPPAGMKGMVLHPGGFAVGFDGKTLYFSDVYHLHAYPTEYTLNVEYDIVGLGISGNTVVVMTTGYPYVAAGDRPDAMSLVQLANRQPCSSKRGIASVLGQVVYPSPDGLIAVSGSNAQLISEGLFKRDDWQDLTPSDFVAGIHDKRYIAFSSTGSMILDFDQGTSSMVYTDETASGVYSDVTTDNLYIIQGDEVRSWRGADTNLLQRWKSGEISVGRPVAFVMALVQADSYPVTLRMFSNQTEVLELSVKKDKAFRLPVLHREKYWNVEVESNSTIRRVALGTNMREL